MGVVGAAGVIGAAGAIDVVDAVDVLFGVVGVHVLGLVGLVRTLFTVGDVTLEIEERFSTEEGKGMGGVRNETPPRRIEDMYVVGLVGGGGAAKRGGDGMVYIPDYNLYSS